MNPLLWLLFLALSFLVLNFRRLIALINERRRVITLIDKIPGPKSLPIIGSALNFSPDSEKSTYQMEYYFRTYTEDRNNTGLMRLWIGPKPIVIVYKAETIKPIMESQNLITKPFEYEFMKEWLGEGLLTSTGNKWYQDRRMLTPTFHFAILADFMECFNRQADILVGNLAKEAENGYTFDLYPYLKALALDIICEAAMGVNMGAQKGKNSSYVASVKAICELMWLRMRSPWLWPKLLWYLSGNGIQFDKGRETVTNFTKQVIVDRKRLHSEEKLKSNEQKETKTKRAFLDTLLEAQEEKGLSDEDIREQVDTFMFEGHDTVSNSMAFFCIMVGHRPEIQEKIYEELKDIFADEPDREVTTEDIGRMKYLDQCIRETMRMFPVVPIIGRIISEDTQIGPYVVPKGVTAMVAPFAVQRDHRFYHDPDHFDPEHFSSENIRHRSPFAYVPFSAGPRNCIGQKFASAEQKVVLSKLFRTYRIICDLHEIENRGLPELILRPNGGTPIRIERRQS